MASHHPGVPENEAPILDPKATQADAAASGRYLHIVPEPQSPILDPKATRAATEADAAASEKRLEIEGGLKEFSRKQTWYDTLAGVKVTGVKWLAYTAISIIVAVLVALGLIILPSLLFLTLLVYHYIVPEQIWLWSEEQLATNVGVIKGAWDTIKNLLPGGVLAAISLLVGPKAAAFVQKFSGDPSTDESDGAPKR